MWNPSAEPWLLEVSSGTFWPASRRDMVQELSQTSAIRNSFIKIQAELTGVTVQKMCSERDQHKFWESCYAI